MMGLAKMTLCLWNQITVCAAFKMTLDEAKDFCNNLTARGVTSVWRDLLLQWVVPYVAIDRPTNVPPILSVPIQAL